MKSYNGKGYKLRKFVSFKDRMKVVDRLVISRNVLMKQSKSWLVSYIIALIEYFTDQLGYKTYKQKLPRLKTHKSSKRKGKYQYQLGHSFVDYDPRYTKLGRRTSYGMQSQVYGKDKPRRKTKRKFSPKQLAAQRLFAKRAKAGTLRRR